MSGGCFFRVSPGLRGVGYPDLCGLETPSECHRATGRIGPASTPGAGAVPVLFVCAVSSISKACVASLLPFHHPSLIFLPALICCLGHWVSARKQCMFQSVLPLYSRCLGPQSSISPAYCGHPCISGHKPGLEIFLR